MRILAIYLKLMRPANLITTLADVLMGYAISGMVVNIINTSKIYFLNSNVSHLYYLIISSSCLYTAGAIFNDLLDAEWDLINHPHKPIPSGQASKRISLFIGIFLTLFGIAAAFIVSYLSGSVAILIAMIAFLHNNFKNHINIGGLLLGMCRSLNLLLGMSIVYATVFDYWYLALIPVCYIGAVTLFSSGGASGYSKEMLESSLLIYAIILIGIGTLTFLPEFRLIHALPFLLIFLFITIPPLYQAWANPGMEIIQKASSRCVHSLIILEATIASGFSGYEYGILILMLLPFSVALTRIMED